MRLWNRFGIVLELFLGSIALKFVLIIVLGIVFGFRIVKEFGVDAHKNTYTSKTT